MSKKIVFFLFFAVLQADNCLGLGKKTDTTSVLSNQKSDSRETSTNSDSEDCDSGIDDCGSRDSKTDRSIEGSIGGSIEGDEKDKSAMLSAESKDQAKKRFAKLKPSYKKLKNLFTSDQKEKVQKLGPSEAKDCLQSAIQEDNVKLVKILLKHRTAKSDQVPDPFTSEDLLEALNQVVSPDNLSKKALEIFNILLSQPALSSNDLCVQDKGGITSLHYAALYSPIDIWKIILDKVSVDDLCVQDKDGMTPLHCLAIRGSCIDIWKIILDRIPFDSFSLCGPDNVGKTPLHCLAILGNDINTWEIILPKISVDSLSAPDKEGKTSLHYLASNRQIKDFKSLICIIKKLTTDPKIGLDRAIKEFLQTDNKGYSVIGYSYLPQSNNSSSLLNNSKIRAFISNMSNMIRGKSTDSKMFDCILQSLPVRLEKEQLGTIVREIEDTVEPGLISQDYADYLCSIIGEYIDKNYGNQAKKVREYVAHERHRKD